MFMGKKLSPSELLNKQIAEATYDAAKNRLIINLSEIHETLVVAESHGIDVFSANKALMNIMNDLVTLVRSSKKLVD